MPRGTVDSRKGSAFVENSMASSADFSMPPLIGKGDGYSKESALKDSFHPDMIGLQDSAFNKTLDNSINDSQLRAAAGSDSTVHADGTSSHGYLSSMQPVDNLPVKQSLNQISVEFQLGQCLVSVLASDCTSDAQESFKEEDDGHDLDADLDLVIDQIKEEQGSKNRDVSRPSGIQMDAFLGQEHYEASPFAQEHDRVFKAFGQQVNSDFPL